MGADTYSATLGYLQMQTGNDNNSWGGNANTAVFQIFEDAIANGLTSTVTGGTLDLSGSPPPAAASQARYAALVFNGVLASNQVVKVPNLSKFWWVQNSTSGAFTLSIQTPSGAAQVIPQNSGWQLVICDGANDIIVSPFNSVQQQMPDGSLSAPAYSWLNEPKSGWRRAGTQDYRLVVNGADILQVTGAGAGSPSIVNVLPPNALQVNGASVGLTVSGTPTTGHVATWASATQLQDGGALGSLATLSALTAKYLDSSAWGMNAPLNISLSASVASNLLTVTMNGANGAALSASNPALANFPDPTLTSGFPASGLPVSRTYTSSPSISTFATGASLGSTSGQSFRFWILLIDNGGTPVLGLINCSTAAGRAATLDEAGVISTVGMTGGANLAGVVYTPNGVGALSNVSYRIIGYLTYETALVTAGTYNNAPDVLRLFGPGVHKPGDPIGAPVYATTTSVTPVSNSTKVPTSTTATITPVSKANLVKVDVKGAGVGGTSSNLAAQISRGSGPTLIGNPATIPGSVNAGLPVAMDALDLPGSNNVTYTVYIWNSAGTGTSDWLGSVAGVTWQSTMTLQEIMG